MKKLFLLTVSSCFAAMSFAQQNANGSVVLKEYKGQAYKPDFIEDFKSNTKRSARKTTENLGGERWYTPFELANQYLGGKIADNANTFVFPIGYDSMYRQQFATNVGAVNYVGIGQFVDPIRSEGFNTAGSGFGEDGDIRINTWNSYNVDSVILWGSYMISSFGNKPNVIDTFIVSIAPVPYSGVKEVQQANGFKFNVTEFAGVKEKGNNKFLVLGDIPTNTTEKTINLPGVKTFKYAIPDTMRKERTATGFPTRFFRIPVPDGGANIPAGNGFAVSVVFRPGEPLANPGVDSVQVYNYFMPIYGRYGENEIMPYFIYNYNDYNMSLLQHYASDSYTPSIILELVNDKQFNKEFVYVGGHVKCSSCNVLAVNDVTNFASVKAYPNPAMSEVRIPFSLKNAATVNVSIANSVGQIVKSQNLGNVVNGEAVFATSDLSSGIYFYTVEANGQRHTGRIAVNH